MKSICLHATRQAFFFPERTEHYWAVGTGCRLDVHEACKPGMEALRSFIVSQCGRDKALCFFGPMDWLHACAVMFLGVCTGRPYGELAEYVEDNVRESEDGFLDDRLPMVKLAREVLYGEDSGN